MTRLDATRLEAVFEDHFAAIGAEPTARREMISSIIETSLRGVDSHGIHLMPHYSRAVRAGRINPTPRLEVVRRGAAAAVLDADHTFGHHAGSVAIGLAEELALASGLGAVAVCNSSHFGAAAYFGLQVARRGHIGLSFTNADSLVAPHGGRQAYFGTNPICFTAPMDGEEPFCLDMATSRLSWNKVLNHRATAEPLPVGALDGAGEPTDDAAAARMLEAVGTYKGYGLGMMVEILCGLLADGPVAREILPMFGAPIEARRQVSHFFAVLRIDAFVDPARFRARLKGMADELRAQPGGVLVAGDPEKRALAERSRQGIPIGAARLATLVEVEPRVLEARCDSSTS
jgi:ureidoglycolate dehydrogenase (NAD+)